MSALTASSACSSSASSWGSASKPGSNSDSSSTRPARSASRAGSVPLTLCSANSCTVELKGPQSIRKQARSNVASASRAPSRRPVYTRVPTGRTLSSSSPGKGCPAYCGRPRSERHRQQGHSRPVPTNQSWHHDGPRSLRSRRKSERKLASNFSQPYRDHRCLRAPRAALPPPRPRERREGRRQPERDHGGVAHEKGQPSRVALLAILTINDARRPLRPHRECRRTRGGSFRRALRA